MIAVTGANGLLGSFIIRKLLTDGAQCVAISRRGSDLNLISDIQDSVTIRQADILNPVALEEALTGVTHVVHAAAIVSFNPARRKEILENNVGGTRNMINAALAQNVRRFVHISSVAALGRQRDQTSIDESNKWLDSGINSTYAESKYLSELEVFRGQEEGLNAVILNPSVILAPANWARSSAQLFKYVADEKKYFIDNSLNYVDVRDVADITSKVLATSHTGRFILNGGSIPLKDLFQKIAVRFSKRAPHVKVSGGMLKFLAMVETARANLLGIEPLLTKETALLAGTHFSYSSVKVRKNLNLEFRNLEETLDWCCQYYLNFNPKK